MKKTVWTMTFGLIFSGLAATALAQTTMTPKAQYATDSRQAQERYAADKKLCNDESSSAARLQCRRDAKSEYDKAVAAAKAQLATQTPVATSKQNAKVVCPDCARVISVKVSDKKGEGSAVGLIAGGVTGAILGHQVGGGMGKDLATVAGAAGGAYAGKRIEENVKSHKVWTVNVQYQDGRKHSFSFEQDPGFRTGDAVRNSGNSIVRQ
jgi:outer membrane lipoprotein SlyB